MQQANLFYRFGAALVIGILVGLQREYSYDEPDMEIFAGARTFALLALTGCATALVAELLNSVWAFVGVIVPLGVLIGVAYFVSAWHGATGFTTEVAAILTILTGALCYWQHLELAAAIAVTVTVLLSLKLEIKEFVEHITREDVYATLKFAVVSAIVLPVLPDQTYGPAPLDILNPYKIWLMVVFISGISFLGYILIKVVGPRQGIGLTGVLGGVVSSTAVTLSFAQRSQKQSDLAKPFALAIMVAWAVMFGRVLVVVATLNMPLLRELWLPMVASGASGLLYCAYLYFSQRTTEVGDVSFSNPFELGPAVKFGLVYAFILLFSKGAQMYLGNLGVYLSSIVGGMADVDTIALSMITLNGTASGVSLKVAAQAIVLAAMSNTVLKGGVVIISGAPAIRRALLPGLLLMLATGISVAFLI